ncbi:type I-F CRISPR-associated endoribonuclease Cas6/Csy4 [Roseiconus lacunae]|uniref:type I-F CRISPR-associated endoribonuclease Cas6/Csy4 n=1 Tax=Roseiconus lacunae TaxID=2605694 RepID=UPI001E57BE20|nr:type I-F CRISPR-associated endoribonuclease Cas6/Csy4 [Roseiconus lacunae]MCD0461983.1 type I-F CRISPR-associated endoribonuclease Cas6/Csy4 [Roseiconus lacunae]
MSTLVEHHVLASHYCEFTCRGDVEISTGFLMGRLLHALHITMVNATPKHGRCSLGITFPQYRPFEAEDYRRIQPQADSDSSGWPLPPIGSQIRLFARSETELQAIEWSRSMVGLGDYIDRSAPRSTPRTVDRFAAFARRQPKGSPERLMRRAMKRHGIDEAEARRRYANYSIDRCRLPWVDMKSEGSRHQFRLFIERIERPASTDWGFSTYGLSRSVGLPDF